MLAIGLWAAALCVVSVTAELTVYPAPQDIQPSNKFQVTVSQDDRSLSSFVYISKSDARNVEAGRSVSWTSFAFSGHPVTVEVTAPRDFQTCKVRPERHSIRCQRSGPRKAQFTVNGPNTFLSVEFDYNYGSLSEEIIDKMLVFADPPETNVPNQTAPGVRYFGPGVHDLNGQMNVDANAPRVVYFGPGQHDLQGPWQLESSVSEVYLAPGFYVHGGFVTTYNRAVKFHGRGVLSGEKFAFKDSRFGYALMEIDHADNSTVEGITMANPFRYYYRGLTSNNVVRGVKMVGAWTHNTDGVAIGPNGLVEDCFILANDDSLKLYNSEVTMRRIVVWQMKNGAVFQTGWWHTRDMTSVRISDIDVIHLDWCVGMRRTCGASQNKAVFNLARGTFFLRVSDVEFKDVRVEGSCPRLIYFKLQPVAEGQASNILFIDWQVGSQPTRDSLRNEISGTAQGRVADWTFQNLRIGGRCVSSAANGDFVIDSATTSSIHFQCGGGEASPRGWGGGGGG